MSAEPAFSVAMPAYDAERTLDVAVASVLAQTAGDLELIIVDDGSSDSTPTLMERWCERDPRVRALRQPNRGVAAARNAAIAAARAPLVGFLDSDDLWMPRYVESMTAALDAAPEAGLAYADAWVFENATGRFYTRTGLGFYDNVPPLGTPRERALEALIEANFVLSPSTCRRRALEAVGGFDERLRGAEDWDLWIRLLAAGWDLVRAPGTLVVGRERAGSLSKDEAMMWGCVVDVLAGVAARDDLPAATRSIAARKLEAARARRSRVTADGAMRAARRLTAAGRVIRARAARRREYLEYPPAEVTEAFPGLFGPGVQPATRDSS